MFNALFERMQERTPVLMMVWSLLENVLNPDFVDSLFMHGADRQYTRTLLFSDIVELMSTVVTGIHTSVHAAFKRSILEGRVSLVALYGKINRIEPAICTTLVHEVAAKLHTVIEELEASLPPLIPGYRTRIVDGNVLGASDHRLAPLRDVRSGPLPGKSLVVLDPDLQLAIAMIPCEDAHTQERALFPTLLESVRAGDAWIADRNFCTADFLGGLHQRGATFLIRQHAKLRWELVEPLAIPQGTTIGEHAVCIPHDGGTIIARRVVVRLDKPTRDGDLELALLTTVPADVLTAEQVAQRYRQRWSVEKLFHTLTTALRCEIKSQGYPKAALFAFAVALVASNIIATVRAGIRAVHGQQAEESLSNFYLVREIQSGYLAFEDGLAADVVEGRAAMSLPELANFLRTCARHVRLSFYRKAPTGPYRTKAKRGTPDDPPHVSTARLILESK